VSLFIDHALFGCAGSARPATEVPPSRLGRWVVFGTSHALVLRRVQSGDSAARLSRHIASGIRPLTQPLVGVPTTIGALRSWCGDARWLATSASCVREHYAFVCGVPLCRSLLGRAIDAAAADFAGPDEHVGVAAVDVPGHEYRAVVVGRPGLRVAVAPCVYSGPGPSFRFGVDGA
jgi:hypothetical protein